MTLRALVVATALCLGLFASSALAASGLSGTATTKIDSPSQYAGEWTLTFTKSGKFKVKEDGHPLDSGTFSSTATTVTFNDDENSCAGPAKYKWKVKADTVTFKKVFDPCADRAGVLSHSFELRQ